ncbi:MAG: cadherin-like beta sandwich domain-containing protein, partial [Ectothiorhodospiraceae bacterium]|nr:cadherin-like beta sandwich domain-containing protein [Ectothiorhodospiraceae bacterium]
MRNIVRRGGRLAVAVSLFLTVASVSASGLTFDFAGLGIASDGFKPQGDRFLVSDRFENDGAAMFLNEGGTSVTDAVIKADNENLSHFDLVDFGFSGFAADVVTLTVEATLRDHSTRSVTVGPYGFGAGEQFTLTQLGAELAAFVEVVELRFSYTAQDAAWNLNFNDITIANPSQPEAQGTTPGQQVTDLAAGLIGPTSVSLQWTPGDGSRRIVLMRQGASGTPVVEDGESYSGSADFSTAPDVGDGWRVVYAGTGSSLRVTGLEADSDFRVVVFEYDGTGDGTAYLSSVDGNVLDITTEPDLYTWDGGLARDLQDENFWTFTDGAIGPDGHTYVLHLDRSAPGWENARVVVMRWNGADWQQHTIFAPGDVGLSSFSDRLSIAIDPEGVIHMVGNGSIGSGVTSNRGVYYGRYEGDIWDFELIEFNSHPSGWLNIFDATMTVTPDGVPHVMYYLSDSDAGMHYYKLASRTGGSWSIDTWHQVQSNSPDRLNRFVLEADSNGALHKLFTRGHSASDRDLVHRTNASGSWQEATLVENNGNGLYVGGLTRMPDGSLWAEYSENLGGDLYNAYALHWADGQWETQVLDRAMSGYPLGIVSSTDGGVAIPMRVNNRFQVAYLEDGGWRLSSASEVDDDVEGYHGISLDDDGNVVIAYANGLSSRPRQLNYFTAIRQESASADLSALAVSDGMLDPPFAPGVADYMVQVPHAVTSVTVTATAEDAGAAIAVNGQPVVSGAASQSIPLDVGDNSVDVQVTAPGGTNSRTYTITFSRAPSGNANLADLSLSAGALTPAFSSGTTSYTATVSSAVSSVQLTPVVEDSAASVTVAGESVLSGSESAPFALEWGDNVISVVVTAQDGTTRAYSVTIARMVPVAATPQSGGTTTGDGDYEHGETVTVVAQADEGYSFAGWSEGGSVVSMDPSYSFT